MFAVNWDDTIRHGCFSPGCVVGNIFFLNSPNKSSQVGEAETRRAKKIKKVKKIRRVEQIIFSKIFYAVALVKTSINIHDALESTKWNWGIYSRSTDWKNITGDTNWVLNSSKKLWYIDVKTDPRNRRPILDNFQPFGGWKSGIGKQ
ncbi:1708_t:CDS:2, partial [Gigaspora margarita]